MSLVGSLVAALGIVEYGDMTSRITQGLLGVLCRKHVVCPLRGLHETKMEIASVAAVEQD